MKFNITDENKMIAWSYINRAIINDPESFFFDDVEKERKAIKLFRAIKLDDITITKNIEEWCESFLLKKEFEVLCKSLRKKDSRQKQRHFSVELIHNSYNELNDLARDEGTTVKEYLAKLIKKEYEEVKPPIAFRKSLP